ncbi:hypothetical protein TNCV_1303481 [Trichonephila clavipes]|nr:hypothetical protein TNCV_1303481 [Trichonephila clavipes]
MNIVQEVFLNRITCALIPCCHTTCCIRALRSARSPDLYPIKHERDIIEWKLQRHFQLKLNKLISSDQEQQAYNSIPQTDIRYLYDTMLTREQDEVPIEAKTQLAHALRCPW